MSIGELRILPIVHIGEIEVGSDLGVILLDALRQQQLTLEQGDIVVVTQKIVSKAEGRIVTLDEIEPSEFARSIAERYNKDAQHVEVVLRESKRIVRMDRGVIISETYHGFICANAGVDESNISGKRQVALLPVDADESAKRLRARLQELTEQQPAPEFALIITDTWGRPWRNGQVNMAIGVSGMESIADYRGQIDSYGYEMHASAIAVADEVAAAAELVMGKIDRVPVALVRGYHYQPATGSIASLVRDSATDMFR